MTPPARDPWTCRYCLQHFVVPTLAREHERTCWMAYGD